MKRVQSLLSKRTEIALQIFGKMIKASRLESNMSQEMLSTRLNVSRLTVIALEKGSPTVSIGTVFEAAAIVGIPLFSENATENMSVMNQKINHFTTLLPHRGGRKKRKISDDF